MSILHIINDKLILNDTENYITDLFSGEMYEKALALFSEQDKQSIFSNELFQRYAVSYIALQDYLEANDVSVITIDEANTDSIVPWLAMDIIKKTGNNICAKWKCNCLNHGFRTFIFYTGFLSLLTGVKLMSEMFIVKRSEIKSPEAEFTVIRSKAAKSKITHVQGIEIFYERMDGGSSVYGLFPLRKRIGWVIQSVVGCRKYKEEQSGIVKRLFGNNTLKNTKYYYCLRNVHTYLYSIIIKELFKRTSGRSFVSGNNLDRYAIIEEETAKRYGISTICIPHGLEYGFELPHCFTGDVFYSTSEYAADYLNKLYKTEKFIFDQELMTRVYKQQTDHRHGIGRIVFFSEPTENYINREILKTLHEVADKIGTDVWVKLHPKDDRKNYAGIDYILFDDDYADAISDNICIARKSTTLLEATYNNSKPCAVILIGKDEIEFNTFPSLQSPLIHVVSSRKELEAFIIGSLKK